MGICQYKVIPMAVPAVAGVKKMDEMAQGIEDKLNEAGADGWDFVQWKNGFVILKREFKLGRL
mgnify:CR=1 FL=1